MIYISIFIIIFFSALIVSGVLLKNKLQKSFSFKLIMKDATIKEFSEMVKQKNDSLNTLYKNMEKTSNDLALFKKRTDELEAAIEHGYSVSIRNIVTEVIAKFDKVEMVFMLAGISGLLKNCDNKEDARFYIKLMDKIQSYIDEMKEP